MEAAGRRTVVSNDRPNSGGISGQEFSAFRDIALLSLVVFFCARRVILPHLKAVVWTAILVAFIYVAAMAIPVLINNYQFQDTLDGIARYASVNHRTNDQIQKAVLDEAQKEDLPIELEDIKVAGAAGNVHINVDYSVVIDLKVFQWTVNFHPAASNSALF